MKSKKSLKVGCDCDEVTDLSKMSPKDRRDYMMGIVVRTYVNDLLRMGAVARRYSSESVWEAGWELKFLTVNDGSDAKGEYAELRQLIEDGVSQVDARLRESMLWQDWATKKSRNRRTKKS